jgi:hypothetical protein
MALKIECMTQCLGKETGCEKTQASSVMIVENFLI